ncbi:MAG: hypothetical protein ACO4CZ_03780 [Planctomycetota bacterium]
MTRRPMRTTVWAFGLLCAAGADLSAQEPVDPFDDAVTKAVTHGRYAVRRAAAGKIARPGAEAVTALRRYVEAHGKNSLPLELVDALAQADVRGPALEALLTAWATDRRFFWRSQALGGLARRGLGAWWRDAAPDQCARRSLPDLCMVGAGAVARGGGASLAGGGHAQSGHDEQSERSAGQRR